MTLLIDAKNLSVTLGGRVLLHNIDLHIAAGEIVTLIGPNGAGKSTLLRTLIGAVPYAGALGLKPNLRIGYVPQKLHLEPTLPLSVGRFLQLPKWQKRAATQDGTPTEIPAEMLNKQLRDLSGGELQHVLLARALINKPELLILDEATQGLDHLGTDAFYRQIEQIRADMQCAIVMASHELHVVMAASDRVICLNGHVCCAGTPEFVAASPAYQELFGTGISSTLALYRHRHDHTHDGPHDQGGHDQGGHDGPHDHTHDQAHDHGTTH